MLRWEKKCLEELSKLVSPARKRRLLPMLQQVCQRLESLEAEAQAAADEDDFPRAA